MLNYFTTSNSFRRTLPDVANLTAMNVWDGVCMCFVFASFVEFVVVNYTGRRKPEPTVPGKSRGNVTKVRNKVTRTIPVKSKNSVEQLRFICTGAVSEWYP